MKNFILVLTIILSGSLYSQKIERDSVVVLVTKAGRAYQNLDTKTSLEYAQKALNQAYEINDNILIARIYNILGLVFTEYSEYKKAEEAFLKGLEALEPTDDIVIKSWLETNIANLYQFNFKDHNKAVIYHVRSLENSKKVNSEYDVLLSIINLSILHFDMLEHEKGYRYLKEAEKYLFKINEPEIFITYNSLNALYFQYKKEYALAEKFYLEALTYCSKGDSINLKTSHEMELYDDIAQFYADRGDKNKGYDFLLKHISLKDSIYSKERTEAIANYVNKIDLDLYKREISKIEKLNDQQQKTIFYSKIVGGLLIFIALNLLVFVILLKRSQRQKVKLINQIEKKNIQLEDAKQEAEKLSELKSQFISNVSHELRTPLYGVIGLAKILEQDYPVLAENKILKSLNFSADYLMNLINDLLQLQKIEANSVTLEQQAYSINHEIKNIVNSLSVIAHKNNNIIEFTDISFDYEIVEVDKLKLNQILYNIISNALKFTQGGKVFISIAQKRLSNKTLELTYTIKDTGSGISKENIEIIFEKFAQFNTKGSDYQGTGLGLPIVKQLIDLFGGTIDLQSEVGLGTEIVFTIPCAIYTNHEEYNIPKNFNNFNGLNVQVLLIENNEINRIVNQRNFDNYNIPCTIVSSAKAALHKLEQNEYTIILTDINMPEIDGFMFAKMVREKGIKTPIIALTAYSKQDIAQYLDPENIQDVVTKPYDFNYLLRVIYKYTVNI